MKRISFNPFRMWGSYIVAITFVLISLYVILNKGDLSPLLVTETVDGGDTTFLGKVVLIIAFPVAFFGLTIEGIIPQFFYIGISLLVEFVYGFLVGWGIHRLFIWLRK